MIAAWNETRRFIAGAAGMGRGVDEPSEVLHQGLVGGPSTLLVYQVSHDTTVVERIGGS